MNKTIMLGVFAALALSGCDRSQKAIDLGEQAATAYTLQAQQSWI